MNVLVVSPVFNGSTSLMRLDSMRELLPRDTNIEVIDTQKLIDKGSRLCRIMAYRYKSGPLVKSINSFISKYSFKKNYGLIWVEKGVLLKPNTIKLLKDKTTLLVHYTPDPAFSFHKSKKFYNSLKYYDKVITTKSFELENYYRYKNKNSVMLVTQAYSHEMHRSFNEFRKRKNAVVFIGHFEKSRGEVLQHLLDNNIVISLSGRGWNEFVRQNKKIKHFTFLGEKTYGTAYTQTLNEYKYSIGFLSEWIPELHTTRTFEIPACGCLLLTPENEEIRGFYDDSDVVFYDSKNQLLDKLIYFFENENEAYILALNGLNKTINGPYSHYMIMQNILRNMGIT